MTAAIALDRVTNHEIVCAERYGGINKRLSRMEAFIITMLLALVGQGWLAYNNSHPPVTSTSISTTVTHSNPPEK